jgi:hypothetical protein
MKDIQEIINVLKSAGCNLLPCSEKEIIDIEMHFNVKLPIIYKQFLLAMGKGAGRFMEGSSVFFDEIFDLKQGTEEIILENELEPLPSNAFVFWMHQGYQMAFFKLDEDLFPVYYFSEGNNQTKFERKENSFLDFLDAQLQMSGII